MRRALAALVACLALVTGCASEVTGDATADAQSSESFDPCTIPDDVITAAGLDPASKDSLANKGYVTPDWTICTWEGQGTEDWYFYSVLFSPSHTLEDVRNDPDNQNFTRTVLTDRDALVFHSKVTPTESACDIAFQTRLGVADFTATRKGSRDVEGDLCEIVRRHTEGISPSLPQS